MAKMNTLLEVIEEGEPEILERVAKGEPPKQAIQEQVRKAWPYE